MAGFSILELSANYYWDFSSRNSAGWKKAPFKISDTSVILKKPRRQ